MKDYDIGKWIIRFILLVSLFIAYDTVMNELDEMIEIAKANKSEINENIDTDSIITMKDLGFDYHKTTNSKLKTVDSRIDPNGSIYELAINNDDVNNYVWLDFTLYKFSSSDIANESFEALTRILYKNEIKGIECHIGTCAIPNIDYETTIQYLTALDLNKWDIDRGFAIKELFTNDYNELILQKGNQIMHIFYNNGSSFNDSNIPTLVSLFEKTDEIFK